MEPVDSTNSTGPIKYSFTKPNLNIGTVYTISYSLYFPEDTQATLRFKPLNIVDSVFFPANEWVRVTFSAEATNNGEYWGIDVDKNVTFYLGDQLVVKGIPHRCNHFPGYWCPMPFGHQGPCPLRPITHPWRCKIGWHRFYKKEFDRIEFTHFCEWCGKVRY